jgi:hypothetical protein
MARQGIFCNRIRVLGSLQHNTRSALVNYYGGHNLGNDSFLSFSLDDMLDNWARTNSQTWENFSSAVTIRPSNVPNHFEWEENRTYTLVCMSKTGEIPLQIEGSVQVKAGDVIKALDLMDFKVRFGSKSVIDFKEWWKTHRVDTVTGNFRKDIGGIIVEYDGIWLRHEVNANCTISDEKSQVAIYEKSHCTRLVIESAKRAMA